MANIKDLYDDCGTISKIGSNGMGIFTYKNDGDSAKLQVAEKCAVGDRVVKPKGKARPFHVIPADEWASMPATEKESKTTKASKETPQLAEILKRLESAEAKAQASDEALAALQAEVEAGKIGTQGTGENS